ncbi:MAG TPA: HEXXH motif-containing putative peptide modification protein [Terriglobia bacterium]
MTDMLAYAPAFASPDGGEATGLVRALALARLNGTRRRIAGALADSGEGETAQALLAFTPGQGSAWRPETGLALQAHRSQSVGLAALQLAAACAGTGGNGSIETRINAPQWLYLDGWLTPVDGRCSLTADGRSIQINSDLGGAEFLASDQNRWAPVDAPSGPWTAYASGGLSPRYVTASGLRHSVEGFPWISAMPPLDAVDRPAGADPRIATIHEGWRRILDQAPVYGSWVASTAAGCLLLDPNGNRAAQSGSSYDHPGLIAIEPPDCPVFCGELLVHECSHQHMLIYTMVAPLVTPGSDETSYSPIKRAYRTMDRVLSGGHAVGNMIIYYAVLRRTMELDPASKERFDQHCTWFADDYRPALDQSQSLTDAGRAFWTSLCKAVDGALEN